MARYSSERVFIAAAAAALSLTPLVVTFAHRGMAPAMLATGLAALAATRLPQRPSWRLASPAGAGMRAALAAALFCGLLLVSCLWSEIRRPWKVWSDFSFTAAASTLAAVAASRLPAPAAARLSLFLLAAATASLALLSIEGMTGGALRAALPPAQPHGAVVDLVALARGVAAATPLVFAAAAILLVRDDRIAGPAVATIAVLAAFAAFSFDVAANTLALAAGAVAFFAALRAPTFVLRAQVLVVVVCALAAPMAALLPVETMLAHAPTLDPSWAQRLFIWREAGQRAVDCAPMGCGADFARALSKLGATATVPGWPSPLPLMPLHPHNVFLQVWMDLGAPGAVLFAAAAWFGAAALVRSTTHRAVRAGAAAMIAAGLVSGLVEASLWQPWRIAAFGFGATGLAIAHALSRGHLRSAPAEDSTSV